MGWENKFHCEINEFCQKVLKYHFPNSIGYANIKKTDFSIHAGEIDILTGGFPCQPYSIAGKRKGKEDDRHLWPEMLRAIREIQPAWVVGENVYGLLNWNGGMVFDEVQSNLENEGYEITPIILPASSVNAPHKRDRIWFIAYSNSNSKMVQGRNGNCNDQKWYSEKKMQEWGNIKFGVVEPINANATNSGFNGCQRGNKELQKKSKHRHDAQDSITKLWQGYSWKYDELPAPTITRTDDGLPDRMDRIKALGNAIVPQVVYQIFKAIEQYEKII